MQDRHTDRKRYFNELAETSRKYYIPYIEKYRKIVSSLRVLEIGCGEGGNLLPFARLGCHVCGIDISVNRINQARLFFEEENVKGNFINCDIFRAENVEPVYDIVLMHDVIEHVHDKSGFLRVASSFLNDGGLLFTGFPAWQMPFGGHQQTVSGRFVSRLPFIHLLPVPLYRGFLRLCSVPEVKIDELLDIKECRTTVEMFRREAASMNLDIIDETMFFINPHYEIKFGLKPRKLCPVLSKIPYLRNYFTTSVFYLLKKK